MNIDFSNQLVVITGGTGNLGSSVIKQLLKNNAKVISTSTNKNQVKKLNNYYKNRNLKFFHLDYKNENAIKNFISEIKKLNTIDILINNAGINAISSIEKIKLKDWSSIQSVNLTGPFLIMREISKKMIKRRKGNILNISSIFGSVGKAERASYSASKWGLVGLTKSSALDLSKYNILVNSLSPGVINSKLTKKILGKKGIENIKKQIPLGRLANSEEITKLIIFLVSKENSYITGQNIIADGGYTCG